tara:strand:- start:110 stop:295 length:186 start_codon:yes stop_codon:yes gene_type:complete
MERLEIAIFSHMLFGMDLPKTTLEMAVKPCCIIIARCLCGVMILIRYLILLSEQRLGSEDY